MVNIVDSIGFDLERVHTGLIAYLVDLWRDGEQRPLRTFFCELGVELQGMEEVKAKKEYKNIDLVLLDQSDTPLVALEMKIHNHETCVVVKRSGGEKAFQTETYPDRVENCPFLYVTLGMGEFYRRKPYGNVCQIGLERFLAAVRKIAGFDPVIRAWENSLSNESKFRTACKKGRRKGGEDTKRWNVYFLGFLRKELDDGKFDLDQADLTAYRHSQDTILNLGIKKSPRVEDAAYCYMEINGNGKLNLKANLEAFGSREDKQAYLDRTKSFYRKAAINEQLCPVEAPERNSLNKSKTLLSFDIDIEKQDGFFAYTEESSREQVCERISKVARWFSETDSR